MTFLNPFVLLGLAAAAIPVILHLLNLRKLRTIEFSTLSFLKELQQTKIRRLKLRQLLLLLVRMLIIIMIVLAFARPALRGTIVGTIGPHAHSSVVFIFDDSFSMDAGDERGAFFKQAREVTGKLVDALSEGDEAFFIRLSDLPFATVNPATHDFAALRTLINETHISAVRRPLEDALRLSARLLSRSRNANREVYIVSDFQRTLLPGILSSHRDPSPPLFDDRVRIFVVNIGTKEPANAAIDSVEVKSTIMEKEQPVVVSASVRNFGNVPLRDHVISMFLDGVRTAQSSVQADPNGSKSVLFTALPKHTGFIKGHIELEHDAIEQDDFRYFSLYIPPRIDAKIVSDSPDDLKFALLALRARNRGTEQTFLNIEQLKTQQLSSIDLKKVDVLTCVNIRSFSGNDADRIRDFVEHGGGLLLFTGPAVDIPNYNETLLPALKIPPIEGIAGNQQSVLTFSKIDLDHPLFASVFEQNQRGSTKSERQIESPRITTTVKRQAGKQGHTIISLGDGEPFLSEHRLGDGRILFFSVPPALSWSDFPVKGVFAPLMYRSVVYASSRAEAGKTFTAGDQPVITLRTSSSVDYEKPFTLLSPDGTEERIRPSRQLSPGRSLGEPMTFETRELRWPGFYEVKNGPNTLALMTVNTDSRESDCTKASSNDVEEFWKALNISPTALRTVHPDEQVQAAILQSRFGVELWKHCVGLALFLSIVEMLIARDSRKSLEQSPLL